MHARRHSTQPAKAGHKAYARRCNTACTQCIPILSVKYTILASKYQPPAKKNLVAEPATRSESGLFVKLLLRGGVSGGALCDTRAIILTTSTKCVRSGFRTFGTKLGEIVLGDYLLSWDATYRSCRTRLKKMRCVPDF